MQNVGRYQIIRKLGQGAMGVVYLAEDPKIGRQVAIKTFDVADAGSEEDWNWLRDRLLAEGNRAGSLNHANIVKVFDVVEERSDLAYIVMEYIRGITLDQYLATHDMPDADLTLRVLRQTADALDYAHTQGIIHRDIKPGNLMIDEGGDVKITDFGIAKRTGAYTRTTAFAGTLPYMAPEQIESSTEVDGRADQYALATVAYILVTGRKPFEGETDTALSHQVLRKQAPPASQFNRELGRPVDSVLKKALSKSPGRRYRTCTEFVAELEAALLKHPSRVPFYVPLTAAVVLAGGLIAGIIYFSDGKGKSPTPPPPPQPQAQAENPTQRTLELPKPIAPVPTPPPEPAPPPKPPVSKHDLKSDVRKQQKETPVPHVTPTPVEPSLTVNAKDGKALRPGQSFREDDDNFGLLDRGELACTVRGSASSRAAVEWYRDGKLADAQEVRLADGKPVRLAYRNLPSPGHYEVRLMVNGKRTKTSEFTIEKAPEQ